MGPASKWLRSNVSARVGGLSIISIKLVAAFTFRVWLVRGFSPTFRLAVFTPSQGLSMLKIRCLCVDVATVVQFGSLDPRRCLRC